MKNTAADKILDRVVERLKEIRLEQGLSHETLAKKDGLSRPAISFVESGKRKPSLLLCLKVAGALNISLGKLLKNEERT